MRSAPGQVGRRVLNVRHLTTHGHSHQDDVEENELTKVRTAEGSDDLCLCLCLCLRLIAVLEAGAVFGLTGPVRSLEGCSGSRPGHD